MLTYKSLNLRWKILLPLLGLSVIPLVISFFFLSSLINRQLDKDMRDRALGVVTVAKKQIEVSQRELLNFSQFLSHNTDLVNAIYYASLTGDTEQVKRVVEGIQKGIHLDLTLVLDKTGKVLLQSAAEGMKVAEAQPAEIAQIQSLLGSRGEGQVVRFDNRMALLNVAPVLLQEDQIGALAVLVFLDEEFVAPLKKTVGAEIAFYDQKKFEYASLAELKQLDLADLIEDGEDSQRLNGADYSIYASKLAGERGMVVAIDNSESFSARRNFRLSMLVVLLLAAGGSLVVGFYISHGIARPIAQVVDNLRDIAEGEGDLTRTLEVESQDEVGALAENFNRFVARLRDMVRRTRNVSEDLTTATEKIRASSREVNQGAMQQSTSLEESFRAIQGIDGAVSGIAESTGSLVEAAEESSSATLELGATIEEIANQMEKLFSTVDEVSSSINQMSVSSQEIAENVEILSSSAEVTASSITELDASIKEIEENAERTNRFSEEAAQDAQKGKEAVDETIQGIGAIREMVDRAGTAIQDLGSQSQAIGKILTVIDEVADQTSLLALNAAIIAAQAGEHGRGFAVVADEIRELAERTAVSTREIAAIIGNLQNGTRDAVKAMEAGSLRVHQEVERSKSAGTALEKIRNSTLKAREQVGGIVRATQEQSRGSRQITNSINQVAAMLDQIASAIKQQTDGVRQLARAAEAMKEIAAQGKLSTGEQAKGSRQINQSMERIRSMIERIDEATREQTQRSRQVVEAVSSIRLISENTALRTAEMDQVVESLLQQTAALEEEVGAFKA